MERKNHQPEHLGGSFPGTLSRTVAAAPQSPRRPPARLGAPRLVHASLVRRTGGSGRTASRVRAMRRERRGGTNEGEEKRAQGKTARHPVNRSRGQGTGRDCRRSSPEVRETKRPPSARSKTRRKRRRNRPGARLPFVVAAQGALEALSVTTGKTNASGALLSVSAVGKMPPKKKASPQPRGRFSFSLGTRRPPDPPSPEAR